MKLCLIEFGNANSTIVMSRKKENDCHADETKKAHPTTKKGNWKTKVVGTMTPLSDTFAPGPFDVICSRGKTAKNHPGNQYYVSVIQEYSERYANTEGKLGKSLIVSEIIDTIRRNSPAGGFVRKDGEKWFEVGDWTAREKVGQSLRDLLKGYKSSASSKKRQREESNAKMIEDLDSLIASNSYISERMYTLSGRIESEGAQLSDMYLTLLMSEANTDILNHLKKEKDQEGDETEDQQNNNNNKSEDKQHPSSENKEETQQKQEPQQNVDGHAEGGESSMITQQYEATTAEPWPAAAAAKRGGLQHNESWWYHADGELSDSSSISVASNTASKQDRNKKPRAI